MPSCIPQSPNQADLVSLHYNAEEGHIWPALEEARKTPARSTVKDQRVSRRTRPGVSDAQGFWKSEINSLFRYMLVVRLGKKKKRARVRFCDGVSAGC